jgi:hypothetical protein
MMATIPDIRPNGFSKFDAIELVGGIGDGHRDTIDIVHTDHYYFNPNNIDPVLYEVTEELAADGSFIARPCACSIVSIQPG